MGAFIDARIVPSGTIIDTDLVIIGAVLRHHPDVNATDKDGRTALFAAFGGLACDPRSRTLNAVPAIRLLVAAGADLNHQDKEGATPLHDAGEGFNRFFSGPDVARTLIRLGAKLNLRNAHGATPLLSTRSPDVALLLIGAGADLSVSDDHGRSILDWARDFRQISADDIDGKAWQDVMLAVQRRRKE